MSDKKPVDLVAIRARTKVRTFSDGVVDPALSDAKAADMQDMADEIEALRKVLRTIVDENEGDVRKSVYREACSLLPL